MRLKENSKILMTQQGNFDGGGAVLGADNKYF